MKTFSTIWVGQFVSIVGTYMTRFGLLIWAYQISGSATTLALLGMFGYLTYVVASPFAGTIVDRFNRRLVMLVADSLAALTTAGLLALLLSGRMELWHLYLVEGLTGAFDAFQGPAYSASISLLVSKEQYGRANGMVSLAASGAQVLAPALAGLVLSITDLRSLLLIDLGTFLVALITLLAVHIPQPQVEPGANNAAKNSLWENIRFGFDYIATRPGLMGILLIFLGINLLAGLTYFAILPAMVLARSGSDKVVLGLVQSMLGIGGVVGGLIFSAWGGPKRRVNGYLLAIVFSFLLGDGLFALGHNVSWWAAGAFLSALPIPFITGCFYSIWQQKVSPDLQGRVFAMRNMIMTAMTPIGYLAGGLLADFVFEPAMQVSGAWAATFAPLVGSGKGAGMGLMFFFTCLLGIMLGFSGYLFPAVRRVEIELPDHNIR